MFSALFFCFASCLCAHNHDASGRRGRECAQQRRGRPALAPFLVWSGEEELALELTHAYWGKAKREVFDHRPSVHG